MVNPNVYHLLVGGFNLSEKYVKSVGMIIPNIWNKKTCSEPPSSLCLWGMASIATCSITK